MSVPALKSDQTIEGMWVGVKVRKNSVKGETKILNLMATPLLKLLHCPVEFSVVMEMFHNALSNTVALWLV